MIPILESGPNSLKISRRNPVAALAENRRTTASGTSCTGNPIPAKSLPRISESHLRKPDARRIPTAVISPTSVGRIANAVWIPSPAPRTKSPYASLFFRKA